MVLKGQGTDACTEDACMARAASAVLTGISHYGFEDVAVVRN